MKSRVSVIRCADYEPPNVSCAVERCVRLLGGIEFFVKKSDTVLIKPNLLAARTPESGVDTHPEVIRSVIRLVRKTGAKIFVGDSPGGYVMADEVYEKSGVRKVCEEEKTELVKFDRADKINGRPIAKIAKECSVIVNVPKLKTHNVTVLTGAVKNMFGTVIGLHKTECHKDAPGPREFAKLIVDIFSQTIPKLSVMDAVVAMEGDGPADGQLRKTGLILASPDAVALDAVISELVGLGSMDLLTTKEASQRALGAADMKDIEVVGEKLDDVRIKDFKFPRTSLIYKAPNLFLKSMLRFVKFRPAMDAAKCTKCGVCEKSCPVNAIKIQETGVGIDYKKCILCLCCKEFCPANAVYLKRSLLAKISGVGGVR